MKRIVSLALVTAASLCVVPALAGEHAAEGGREFGDAGVLGIGAETRLDALYTSTKPKTGDSSSETRFGLGANLAYFVAPNVSVGGVLSFDHLSGSSSGSTSDTTESVFTVMPMLGYHLWLQPKSLSLWPQVGLGWSHTSMSFGGADSSNSKLGCAVFVPVLIHAAEHFHFGVGPYFSMDLTSSSSATTSSTGGTFTISEDKNTTFGLKGEIAGWL